MCWYRDLAQRDLKALLWPETEPQQAARNLLLLVSANGLSVRRAGQALACCSQLALRRRIGFGRARATQHPHAVQAPRAVARRRGGVRWGALRCALGSMMFGGRRGREFLQSTRVVPRNTAAKERQPVRFQAWSDPFCAVRPGGGFREGSVPRPSAAAAARCSRSGRRAGGSRARRAGRPPSRRAPGVSRVMHERFE